MAHQTEIERKFLVDPAALPPLPPGARLVQGYLALSPTIRVRTEDLNGHRRGYLNIKGEGLVGREEFEYVIPFEEAEALLRLATGSLVSKTRHTFPAGAGDLKWEVDLFDGLNEGLAVAEIELPAADAPFPRPGWLGEDVTEDPAYKNVALALRPYRTWRPAED